MESQMTIGKKISLMCALLVIFTVTLGVTSLVSMTRMDAATQSVVGDALPGVYFAGRVESMAKDVRAAMTIHIGSDKAEDFTQLESTIAQGRQNVLDALKEYEKTITRSRDRELHARMAPAFEQFLATWEKPRSLSRALKPQEAMAVYRSESVPAFTVFQKAAGDLLEFNRSSGDEFARQSAAASSSARYWTWGILLSAVSSGVILAIVIVRGISRLLIQSASELRQGADQVASAASQVTSSSQSLAQGASEQAAALEETSASSEEINSMARKNSENSRAAASLMSQSQQKFVQTNQSLDQMVLAMSDINTQSDKISKIIKVIDEIAFQTNILALNAAVEAARAGEAGMGFAVVADEVRNLAQRCSQAAKDTAELIEESIAKSNDGKSKVDQVADAIRGITDEVARMKSLVDDVDAGSEQQSVGIGQVSQAISQMEQVTQKNAADAEESAAAAEQLNAQSMAMKDVVSRLSAMVGGDRAA